MRKAALAIVIVLTMGLIPAVSQAARCPEAADRTGDAAGIMPRTSTESLDAIDVSFASVAVVDGELVGTVDVVDAALPASGSDLYQMDVTTHDTYSSVAFRVLPDGVIEGAGDTEGRYTYDVEADGLTIAMPMDDVMASVETVNVSFQTAHYANGSFATPDGYDYAPDSTAFSVHPAEACTTFPTQGPTEMCAVLTDPANDGFRSAPDLIGLSMGATAELLRVEVGLRPEEDASDGDVYVSFNHGDRGFDLTAARRSGGTTFFMSTPEGDAGGDANIVGADDRAAGMIRFDIPRAAVDIPDGEPVSDIMVRTYEAVLGVTLFSGDGADEYGTWVAGPTCTTTPTPACPLVADEPGDAGYVSTGSGALPRNEPALDIVAVGARSDATELSLSLAVPDLTSPAPEGFDGIAWTMSWASGEDERIALQAMRFSDGTVGFGYATVEGGGDYPSSLIYEGAEATGSIDDATGIVTVTVPVEVAGPESVLSGVGATATAIQSGNSVGASMELDYTDLGSYSVGTTCSLI